MSRLTQRAEGLWTVDAPLTTLGARLGCRATLLRLPDGALWLHSPVPLDDALVAEIRALGEARHLVAPNTMHHLSLASAKERFSGARVYAPAGLRAKVPTLPVDELLGEAPPASWGGALSLRRFEGAKKLDEWAFFHAPSRTLIVTDLAFNYPEVEHWWTRWFFTLTGALGKFGPTRILLSFVDDVAAAKESVAGMCRDWDFERVIVAHGEVREGDAREALAAGWAAV
ncbi:MAG: DUF4336 domain-containing protein [Alphaproteobacteria bacterium]|nr:DUF4336 domain-containing protein [Alphaproteobacteria bacterium]